MAVLHPGMGLGSSIQPLAVAEMTDGDLTGGAERHSYQFTTEDGDFKSYYAQCGSACAEERVFIVGLRCSYNPGMATLCQRGQGVPTTC